MQVGPVVLQIIKPLRKKQKTFAGTSCILSGKCAMLIIILCFVNYGTSLDTSL